MWGGIVEEWRPIKDWETLYEVSNLGNVRNVKTGKLIIGDINNCGYYRVSLYQNNRKQRYFRHRLVAEHFIVNDDIDNKRFVNHIDGDKSNNTVHNLEWATQSENEKHAFKKGLKQKTNKPFMVVFEDGSEEFFETQHELAERVGLSQAMIYKWFSHKSNSYRNYGIVKLLLI